LKISVFTYTLLDTNNKLIQLVRVLGPLSRCHEFVFFLRFLVPDSDSEGSYSDPKDSPFLHFGFLLSDPFSITNVCRDRRVGGGDHHPHLNSTGSGPLIITPLNGTSSTSTTRPYSARNCNLRFHVLQFEKKK
jgi:hypothetical protein